MLILLGLSIGVFWCLLCLIVIQDLIYIHGILNISSFSSFYWLVSFIIWHLVAYELKSNVFNKTNNVYDLQPFPSNIVQLPASIAMWSTHSFDRANFLYGIDYRYISISAVWFFNDRIEKLINTILLGISECMSISRHWCLLVFILCIRYFINTGILLHRVSKSLHRATICLTKELNCTSQFCKYTKIEWLSMLSWQWCRIIGPTANYENVWTKLYHIGSVQWLISRGSRSLLTTI